MNMSMFRRRPRWTARSSLADFERARTAMLRAFCVLVEADLACAKSEIEGTSSAMLQIVTLAETRDV